MYSRLIKLLKSHHFFLFGARGPGKTTYLQNIFKDRNDVLRVDLLDLELEERYSKSPKDLIEQLDENHKIKYVIIDEIQKIPKLLDLIHQYIQKNKDKVIFVLTGSSAKKLKRGGANLLAGRAFVYNLFPLTYLELKNDFNLDRYLHLGGLPEVYSFSNDRHAQKFLKTYALTYLKEEVWSEQFVKKLDPFRKFLELAACANGEIVNYSKLAKQVGVDTKTVQSYFHILEETLVAFVLKPFSTSIRKRLVKSPKFYFFDIGIKRALEQTLSINLKQGTFAYGKAFEHFIVTQIIYLINYYDNDFSYYYLKTEAGVEVDLILQRPDRSLILIEIKSTSEISKEDIKHLVNIRSDLKNSKAFLLSNDPIGRKIDDVHCLQWNEGIRKILK